MRNHYSYMDEEGQTGGGGGEDTRDYATEASKMGWHPKEKWTGDPEKWVDAKEFVERGEKVLPIVLAQKRELEQKYARLEAETAQMRKDVAEFKTFTERASAREKAELKAQLDAALAARKQAITDGDGDAFTQADEQVQRIKDAAKEAEGKPAGGTEGNAHPDYAAWVAENQWYVTDTEMQIEANGLAISIAGNKRLQGRPLYDEVTKRIKKLYPEKFNDTINASRGNVAESHSDGGSSGGNGGVRNGKSKTYENLPEDAKRACDKFIKQGFIQGKDLAEKRAKYCAEYDWS